MTPRRQAVVAVMLAALVATAMPAAAADPSLETVSIHTTDSEFSGASLSNMSVQGTGTSANVVTDPQESTYSVVSDSGDGGTDETTFFVGDTGSNTLIHSEAKTVPNTTGTVSSLTIEVSGGGTQGSDYGFVVDVYAVQENPDGTYGEGTLVKDDWNPDFSGGDQTFQFDSNLSVDAGETWTFEFVTQSTDNDGTADSLDIWVDNSFNSAWYSERGNLVDFGANLDLAITEPTAPAEYVSINHTVENSEGGFVHLTENTNATVTVTWEGWDGSSWTQLDQMTGITSTGNHTFTWSKFSGTKVRVTVTVNNQSGNGRPSVTMADEGVQFQAATPSVDNGNASPQGDKQVNTNKVTLSIPVSDADFATAQGDSVDVEFYVDGSKVATKTITSNKTVEYTATISTGGNHTWHVVATDSYGDSTTSNTFKFDTPSTLYIRNVSDPDSLVNNSVTVEVTFFTKDGTDVITRTTTDGKINMTGLPVDKEFVVVARADKYYNRRVIIDDLFSQNSIYLLPTNATAYDIVFRIDDSTGEFTGAEETELIIQRALNRSGTTKWRTVMGDQIGASHEAPATLEDGIRYRIIVRTNTSRRVLGHYIPVGPQDPEILPIGEVSIQGNITQGVAFGARIETVSGTTAFRYAYTDPEKRTSELRVRVYNESASGDPKIYDANTTGPLGTVIETVDFGSRRVDSRYKVVWNATFQDGSEVNDVTYVGTVPTVGCFGLGGTVCELTGYLVIVLTFGLTIIKSPSLSGVATVIAAFAVDLLGMVAISSVQIGVAGGIALLLLVGRR